MTGLFILSAMGAVCAALVFICLLAVIGGGQAAEFMPALRAVVSVGRVKWIPDSKMTGKDNCAWHLFDADPACNGARFYGRLA